MNCVCCLSKNTQKFISLKRGSKTVSSWGVPFQSQTIFQCRDCTLQFTDRVLTEAEIEAMYGQSYHDHMAGSEKNELIISGIEEQSQLRLKLVENFKNGGNLLDVGCSTGIFLEKSQQAGYSVFGLDTSQYACEVARKKLGLGEDRIIQSNLGDASILREKKFDVITGWDVIEHCSDPRGDMEVMAGALKPGGILVLRTPNTASIFFRVALLLSQLSFGGFRGPLTSLYHADHLVFFNPKSLGRLYNQFGLKVVHGEADPLLWKRFKYCELRRGPILNFGISSLYFFGRAIGSGHGLIAVGQKD